MVSFGNASGVVSIPNLTILASKGSLYLTRPTGSAYFPTPEDYRHAARAVFEAVRSGAGEAKNSRRFPLKDAADAHKALADRQTTGAVILLP
jgi:NADPH2:quinone reductase